VPNLQFNISKLSPLFKYLEKQRQVEKNRKIFELSITFGLISFFLFFAVRPTLLTISALIGDVRSKKVLSTTVKAKIDQIIIAQDNFASIQEKYFLVEEAFPSHQNYVGAMNLVDSATSQNNITLDKINFTQSKKNYFSTQISTSSSFMSTINLIDNLSHARRLLDISQITFSQDKENQSQGKISFVLPINIFFENNSDEKK